jgi:GrpB-like predicted nucleotidyltransferase (UPF0157 family)
MIEVVAYNPQWAKSFDGEAVPIKIALGERCLALHHIGSTAVPGQAAKPKIDILVVVPRFSEVDIIALENISFESRGEIIPTGRFFSKRATERVLKVNLHLFEEDNPTISRNLLFRDWLRDHKEDREAYGKLKRRLATEHTDGMEYCRDKTAFINSIIDKAMENS